MFLHGYLSDGKAFVMQERFFNGIYRCFAPDLVGFGENKEMPFAYSLDDYIASVKEYMQQNGIVKPDVIAHSFGARIAVKMASLDKDIFGKIIITGGAGLKPKRKLNYFIKKIKFSVLKKFVKREKLKKYYSSDYLALSPIMRESFKKIISEHLDENAKVVENKVLLVYGEKDTETPLYMAKRYKNYIKNSTLKIIKEEGHFCFLTAFNYFNTLAREFLLDKGE